VQADWKKSKLKQFLITSTDDLHKVSGYVFEQSESGKLPLKVEIKAARKRSLSQNAFSHVIYQEISKNLIQRGREDCSPEWIKQMLKNTFLGWHDVEIVNVVTGQRQVRSELRHTSKLDKGEMMNYLTQIIDWAESIGCQIKIPSDSEYMKLRNSQNE